MRYRYSIDRNNQLLINTPKLKLPLRPAGKFSIDKNNRLIYRLNRPGFWRKEYNLPGKIRFTGNWRLDSEHNLELILTKTHTHYRGDRLAFSSKFLSARDDAFVFEIISHTKQHLPLKEGVSKAGLPETSRIQLLKLTGYWRAGRFNRLQFAVKKKTQPDILTLDGIWQINKNQWIVYTRHKANLKKGRKIEETLVFRGYWQIDSSRRLTYILSEHHYLRRRVDLKTNSYFEFRVQIETPSIYPKKGVIKYRLGIGLKGLPPKGPVANKVICLYGVWRFSRRVGLFYEMKYGRGITHALDFGAEVYIDKKDKVVFKLMNKENKPLGLAVMFRRRFFKGTDAQVFLKGVYSSAERVLKTGLRFPF
jgi:hypothetical protein